MEPRDHNRNPATRLTSGLGWALPSVADWIFLVILLRVLQIGCSDLLNDPGIPWHIQLGIEALDGRLPQVDEYSFTRSSHTWISQYWLFDIMLAVLYQSWSWNGPVVLAAIVLAWTYRGVFRSTILSGSNLVWGVLLTLMAAGCGAGNWLARPHLLSLMFVAFTFHCCSRYHRGGSLVIWSVPLLMIAWCNMHGGFLAGLVVLGCSALGQLLCTPRDRVWRHRVTGFLAVLALAALATFINPYGWHLHAHLFNLLFSSNVRDLIVEWRAPDLQQEHALEYLILLALVIVALSHRRLTPFHLVHLVVWLHFGLLAVRQAAFLGIVAAPILGDLAVDIWASIRGLLQLKPERWSWIPRLGYRLEQLAGEERGRGFPGWPALVTVLLLLLTGLGARLAPLGIGTARLDPEQWPQVALDRLNQEPDPGPVFHDLDWGGYLILNARPRPVFIDDRFELYGRRFVLQYLDAMNYGPSWNELLDKYGFGLVLIRPQAALAKGLRSSEQWRVIHEEPNAVIFRRQAQESQQSQFTAREHGDAPAPRPSPEML